MSGTSSSAASKQPRHPFATVVSTAALAALPGVLAGIQLNGLLFFLNPHLPFAPGPWLRGALRYSSLLGLLSLLLLLLVTRGRSRRVARFLPWALFVVFTVAAIYDSVHASLFSFYLPPGINRRLIKAALWLSLGAIIAFYTALVHAVNRRPYGWRSRSGLTLLAVLSIYVVVERREAYRPRPEAAPRPSTVATLQRPNLVVVGVEAGTLDAVLPLAQRGQLPFFAAALEEGAYGRLRTLRPTRREPLWITLGTGKLPYQHGVVAERTWPADFLVPGGRFHLLPVGMLFERWGVPPSSTLGARARREALTLWEISSRLGLETAVVGWPASDPPPAGAVAAWSDRFFQERPAESLSVADLVRIWSEFDPTTPPVLRQALSEDARRFLRAVDLLPSAEPESSLVSAQALFLVLPGLSTVSARYFGGYSAVQFDGSQAARDQEANRWIASYYAYLDSLLEQLWERIPEPRLLLIVSAHGVEAPEGTTRAWRRFTGQGTVGGVFRGAPDGLFILRGEGVRPDTFLPRLELIDVAPMLLYSLGLPLARDLPGELLTEAFSSSYLAAAPVAFVPSYESLTVGPLERAVPPTPDDGELSSDVDD